MGLAAYTTVVWVSSCFSYFKRILPKLRFFVWSSFLLVVVLLSLMIFLMFQHLSQALMSSTSTSSTYSKACLAIDEMLPGGILESLDPDAILSAIKLQNPVATSKQGR